MNHYVKGVLVYVYHTQRILSIREWKTLTTHVNASVSVSLDESQLSAFFSWQASAKPRAKEREMQWMDYIRASKARPV